MPDEELRMARVRSVWMMPDPQQPYFDITLNHDEHVLGLSRDPQGCWVYVVEDPAKGTKIA